MSGNDHLPEPVEEDRPGQAVQQRLGGREPTPGLGLRCPQFCCPLPRRKPRQLPGAIRLDYPLDGGPGTEEHGAYLSGAPVSGAQQHDVPGQRIPVPPPAYGGQDAGLLFRGALDYRASWHRSSLLMD